jgi:hypothetical protein
MKFLNSHYKIGKKSLVKSYFIDFFPSYTKTDTISRAKILRQNINE